MAELFAEGLADAGKEVTSKAVATVPAVLQYASEELRADRSTVLKAVAAHPENLQFVSADLQTDPEVLTAALDAIARRKGSTRPKASFGAYEHRPTTEPSAAVNVAFDRIENWFPRHVPRLPAHIVYGVGLALSLSLAARLGVGDWMHHRHSTDVALRHRWMAIFFTTAVLGHTIASVASDFTYRRSMFRANRQHFANLHWLGEYASALRVVSNT